MTNYLSPTTHIDSQHPHIIAFAQTTTQHLTTPVEQAVAIYETVRDQILYDPYTLDLTPQHIKASITLARGRGYCIEKSMVMAAACRAVGIPARLGFANVRNHLATPKFIAHLRTDVFVFHGYVSLWLNEKWVKATPVFDRAICQKFGVPTLDFDGQNDAILQTFDANDSGKAFMEYLCYHGEFEDLPYSLFVAELQKHYPHFFGEHRHSFVETENLIGM